jgi:hypothetical protein
MVLGNAPRVAQLRAWASRHGVSAWLQHADAVALGVEKRDVATNCTAYLSQTGPVSN